MSKTSIIKINNLSIANNLPFALIAGPCQIENLDHALFIAEQVQKITTKLNIPFIYKSSFDKANRTSAHAERGAGLDEGLDMMEQPGKGVPHRSSRPQRDLLVQVVCCFDCS